MGFDFPNSPTSGQVFGNYSWDGEKWTSQILTAPVNTALPVISGTTQAGSTLTTTNGTWTNSPTGYTYQWLRGGVNISGATASTYLLVTADVGATITATVTATNIAGSASVTSAGVGPITAALVPTTLNPSDKDTHITLSGGNLTAAGTAGWTGLVRSISSKSSGKFYWETTFNATQTNSGVGIAIGSLSVSTQTFANAGTGKSGLTQSGGVWLDGASSNYVVGGVAGSTISFGTITSGTVICVAVDIGAQLIWWRLGASGNWNNNASRNPATGAGGASIPNVGTAFATDCFGGADTLISNFGGSAFTGAVPSGFTAGWTT